MANYSFTDLFAGDAVLQGQTMPEQARDLAQSKLACPGALDQREQRTKFLFSGNQRGKRGAQNTRCPADGDRSFPAMRICYRCAHAGLTMPELSSCIV